MMLLAMIAGLAGLSPVFTAKPCAEPAISKIAACGSVEVPEDRARPAGRQIALNVILLRATSPAPHLPALFDIDGGPGLAVTKNAGFYASEGAAYRARRDIVMVDQRGTGGSNRLTCPELSAPEAVLKPLYPVEGVKRCRAALEQKADLTRYLTHDAVADLDAVREALGYDRIDLFGLSYGTTVALRYLGTHPERVRAAVLIGVAPPSAMPPASHATAAERAFTLLAAQCEADPTCGPTYDLTGDYDRAVASLPHAAGAPDREIFAEKLRSMMYQPATARSIPYIVHAAAKGDLAPFRDATKRRGPGQFADGMFLSVTCAEALSLMDFGTASRAARTTRFGDYRLRRQRDACGAWPVGTAAPDFLKVVTSPAKVLLISGGLDPVTPPEWADAVAKSLPNSRHVVIPASGHIFDGLSGIETCLDPLVRDFLDTGDLKAIDPTCLAAMQPPPFMTRATP